MSSLSLVLSVRMQPKSIFPKISKSVSLFCGQAKHRIRRTGSGAIYEATCRFKPFPAVYVVKYRDQYAIQNRECNMERNIRDKLIVLRLPLSRCGANYYRKEPCYEPPPLPNGDFRDD